MKIVKYRMIFDNGYIETLDEQQAKQHGEYIVIEEEIEEIQDEEEII
jgi:hypothetical protein